MIDALVPVLIFMPLILAVLATVISSRSISRPALFFLTSTLTMLGLQGIVAPAALSLLVPVGGAAVATDQAVNHSLLIAAALQLFIGIPFLGWLANGLRKP